MNKSIYFEITLLFLTFGITKANRDYPFFSGKANELILNNVITTDNGNLVAVYDSLPLFYYQDIATSVCHNFVCKPAYLRIYWDASGNFLGFKIPDSFPLTKIKHKEFTEYDYFILYSILNNPYSVIGKLKYEELTADQQNAANEIDGRSGATTIVDKHAVVAGAVYTCYTLWHIVNDSNLILAMQNYSKSQINKYASSEYQQTFSERTNKMHPGQLALFLLDANSERKLRKLKYQKLLTNYINNCLPLNALIINNYLSRQVFVFPEIEKKLIQCKENNMSFRMMIYNE